MTSEEPNGVARRRDVWGAFALVFLSGATGLAHQTLWTRRLVDLLGASHGVFARVVGAFFLGLALGSWAATRWPVAGRRGWMRVAIAELAVGLLSVPALTAVTWAPTLPPEVARWLWPAVLVLPPASAMGLVLPAVFGALADEREENRPVWLYSVNTLGGLAGLAWLIFGATGRLGLTLTGGLIIAVNGLVAVGAGWLGRGGRELLVARPAISAGWSQDAGSMRNSGALWLAFLSGAGVLALEVLTQHQAAQVTINSFYSGALGLGVVLSGLAVGAALTAPWRRWLGDARALPWAAFAAALLVVFQPWAFVTERSGLRTIPYELLAWPYTVAVFRHAVLTVWPVFTAAGLIFPLLLRGAGDREAGRLLMWNGVGGWLGAELAESAFAPTFGLWRGVVLVGAIYGGIWAATTFRRMTPALGVAAVLALLAGLVSWRVTGGFPQVQLAPGERAVEIRVGREGVVGTVTGATNDWRILFNNSYTLGGSRARANQERQAHLPILLHGAARQVALLGLATGGTAGGATLHPKVERIEAFELSPLAAGFAARYFASWNREVLRNPKVQVTLDDARTAVAGRRGEFDVVVGDLFLPWRTGEGRLFTTEHFAGVRRALKPDGLFCQWLPLFQLTRPQYEGILRTFRAEFPRVFLLRGDFYADLPIVGLVAFADGRSLRDVDWGRVRAGCDGLRSETRPAIVTTDPLVRQVEGIAMCVLGEPMAPPAGPLNTLGNVWLETDAGRNIVGLQTPWFVGVPLGEYVREVVRAGATAMPEELRSAQDAGQFFLTLEIAARSRSQHLDNLRAQIDERLPVALRTDPEARWIEWPGQIKPSFPR